RFSYLMPRPPPSSTLFPYTTLFRSRSARDDISSCIVFDGFCCQLLNMCGCTAAGVCEYLVEALPAHAALQALIDQCLQLSDRILDRKSTRLNSSHVKISYAVFCLKK